SDRGRIFVRAGSVSDGHLRPSLTLPARIESSGQLSDPLRLEALGKSLASPAQAHVDGRRADAQHVGDLPRLVVEGVGQRPDLAAVALVEGLERGTTFGRRNGGRGRALAPDRRGGRVPRRLLHPAHSQPGPSPRPANYTTIRPPAF